MGEQKKDDQAKSPQPRIDTLFSAAEIADCVARLADEMTKILPSEIVLLSLLKGSFMFTADLVRDLHRRGITSRVEFLKVSTYGDRTSSSGTIRVDGDLPHDLENC
ncbi:MAG: hypothetical protein O7C63_04375, partial [Alphaproteobacteria bacterium]|nr:hypothetical protein [Alphaproteobacteria bacterium]